MCLLCIHISMNVCVTFKDILHFTSLNWVWMEPIKVGCIQRWFNKCPEDKDSHGRTYSFDDNDLFIEEYSWTTYRELSVVYSIIYHEIKMVSQAIKITEAHRFTDLASVLSGTNLEHKVLKVNGFLMNKI